MSPKYCFWKYEETRSPALEPFLRLRYPPRCIITRHSRISEMLKSRSIKDKLACPDFYLRQNWIRRNQHHFAGLILQSRFFCRKEAEIGVKNAAYIFKSRAACGSSPKRREMQYFFIIFQSRSASSSYSRPTQEHE